MPELPEVETVVRDLRLKIIGRRILDVWTDWPKYFKPHYSLATFKKHVLRKKIEGVERRGKNILIHLSDKHLLLIHLKMTGHPLVGKWQIANRKWIPVSKSKLMADPKNGFIRLILFLDGPKNSNMLALSDLRRFAKVLCGPKEEIFNLPDLKGLGPEALVINFREFSDRFEGKRGKIKQVLMDQSFVVGIGNIYSDEVLYKAKIHPASRVEKLKEKHLKAIFKAMREILNKGIKFRGTSSDDFRDTAGKKGEYGKVILVYQKTGQKCPKKHIIQRMKIGGRSAHFCSKCQELIS
ncbi:MAG: bifunctional DNA-formamidopyrimidine glycosylase/DNA-(apurinic or apyrimidinic site) lyase [Candidatus Paceibacterota bacterium]|jgi:formamidopyrimidine-DNA glycosylase